MPALIDILKKSEKFLRKKGISNARFDSECILTKALGCKRIDLYLNYMANLSDAQLGAIRILLTRRARHEPLQYLLGRWPFYDLMLNVDRRTLIPRPETEELVELLMKKRSKHGDTSLSILDLGTGSGAIALSLAKYFRRARVHAIDISLEALSLARENAAINSIANVTFVQSDWYSNIAGQFDIIVSNPPYLSEAEWEHSQPEIRIFEPKLALVSEDEGNGDIVRIIDQSVKFLRGDGILALETGELRHRALLEFAKTKFHTVESSKDRALKDRFIVLSKPRL
jgi:release factor glutamine methyltransferase